MSACRELKLKRSDQLQWLDANRRQQIADLFSRDCFPATYRNAKQVEGVLGMSQVYWAEDTTTNQIVAVLVVTIEEGRPTIWNVCTSVKNRGRGCARRLIQSAVKSWRRRHKTWADRSMYLYVHADNVGAKRLYEKIGFRVIGQNPTTNSLWLKLAHE